MNFIKKAYNQQPVATALVGAVALFFAYRKIKGLFNKPVLPNVPPIPPVPSKGQSKYSFGIQEYVNFADNLFGAMYDRGTDEDRIALILGKMKTYDDVLALIDAYGKRKLKTPIPFVETDPMTLAESFYYEMPGQNEVDQYVNQPLKKTGFKF